MNIQKCICQLIADKSAFQLCAATNGFAFYVCLIAVIGILIFSPFLQGKKESRDVDSHVIS